MVTARKAGKARKPRKPRQLGIAFPSSWGGRRKYAGRKPSNPKRSNTPHRPRPHKASFPLHVTLRARVGLPSFREAVLGGVLREAVQASQRTDFRMLHYSIQRDHVHLIVEASSDRALSGGMRGLSIRAARQINRALETQGPVWGDRYHSRALKTPKEVQNAVRYVLQNFREHTRARQSIDPWSSGRASTPVVRPRTWLADRVVGDRVLS